MHSLFVFVLLGLSFISQPVYSDYGTYEFSPATKRQKELLGSMLNGKSLRQWEVEFKQSQFKRQQNEILEREKNRNTLQYISSFCQVGKPCPALVPLLTRSAAAGVPRTQIQLTISRISAHQALRWPYHRLGSTQRWPTQKRPSGSRRLQR